MVLWHVELVVVLVSLVSLFVLNIEIIEIDGVGRRRACARAKSVVRIVVVRDVVSELLFGL